MIKKALVFAVAAACLTSGAAFAQSYGYSNDSNVRYERQHRSDRDGRHDRNDRQYSSGDYRGNDGYQRGDRYNRDDRYSRRDNSGYRDHRNDYQNNRYYGQQQVQHRRGGYVSHQYRDQRYVVSDWRARRLYQPQHGYHWVQTGNSDYVLAAIATGLIAQVLLNH